MIKYLVFISLTFVLSLNGLAQKFNRSYDFLPNALTSYNLEQLDQDTFIITAANFNSNSGRLGISNFRINGVGDTITSSLYLRTDKSIAIGWANSISLTSDSALIMGGGIADTIDQGHLVKFNRQGDTIWTKSFGDTSNAFNTFRQAIQTKDGGFIAVGQTNRRSATLSDGWLVKTDSAGNLEWEKVVGRLNELDDLTSVSETTDGGYICGGIRRHFAGNPPVHNTDPIVIKVDSIGRQQWHYVYDTPFNEASAYAIQTADGNYVFSSSISVFQSSGTVSDSRAALFKVSTNGGLLWAKTYGAVSTNNALLVVKELADSSLIAVGRRFENNQVIKGLMVHADKDGDSIFIKSYEENPLGTYNQNYLWDVIPMDDGGFMACGEVIDVPPSLPANQDAWVIRVDSNGCILSNCTVGLNNLFSKKETEAFTVYPNPSSGIINIATKLQLSSIEVFNIQGQKVQDINPSQLSWKLPTAKGIYFVRLITKDGVQLSKKVVRE